MKVKATYFLKNIRIVFIINLYVLLSFYSNNCKSGSLEFLSIKDNKRDTIGVSYLVSGSLIEEGVKRKKSDFFGFTIVAYEVLQNKDGSLYFSVFSENQKVTTGKKGYFTLKLNSAKRYLIKCVKPGYLSDEVPLPKRNIAEGQHISLEIAVRKSHTAIVSGFVFNEIDNSVLQNAEVTLRNVDKGIVESVFTGKDGSFSFEILKGEDYRLRAEKPTFMESSFFSVNFSSSRQGMLRKNIYLKSAGLGKTYKLSGFHFGVNERKINKKQALALKEAVKIIIENPEYQFEVACFSDARGDDEYNLNLTIERAKSIVDFLVKNYEVMPDRLVPKGYGETYLLNECSNGVYCNTEKHEENRRIELRVLKLLK